METQKKHTHTDTMQTGALISVQNHNLSAGKKNRKMKNSVSSPVIRLRRHWQSIDDIRDGAPFVRH